MQLDNIIIPDWVRWLAQDKDGSLWGYSAEPHLHDSGWYENEVGDCQRLGRQTVTGDWRKSLRKHP
jgi:hypothetical protein